MADQDKESQTDETRADEQTGENEDVQDLEPEKDVKGGGRILY